MDITGKIIAVLEPRGGVSKSSGNPWKVQEYVIETHDQYPRKCAFEVFGEERIKQFNIQVGQELTVSFDVDAHEYNGRWFSPSRREPRMRHPYLRSRNLSRPTTHR